MMPRKAMDARWLNIEAVADVVVMVDGRREPRRPGFWSADRPGVQTIEIRFHDRTPVRRLCVVSSEVEQTRTQEMAIWVSLRGGERHREVLRQQFTFSPGGATEEVEEYDLELEEVSTIQLRIVPSIDGRSAVARVDDVRVASV